MHLLSPLISGVQNAGGGSAQIYRRGTTVLATVYSSYEGDSFASSQLDNNSRVKLDAYGRAEVYVNEVCDVSIYDADGQLQIAFTAGYASSAIEVRSRSFTGHDYVSGAADTSEPTTLQEVLDLWWSNREGIDWADNISQPLFVVTDYGALGDGTTDDAVAIQAAFAAAQAAQGIVFFPDGLYRVTSTLAVSNVAIVSNSATLQMDHATADLLEVQGVKLVGLGLETTGTGTLLHVVVSSSVSQSAMIAAGGQPVLVDDGITLKLDDCSVSLSGASSGNDLVRLDGTSAKLFANRCTFSTALTYAPTNAAIYGNNLHLDRCTFLATLTAGTFSYLKFSTTTIVGTITNCAFGNPSSGTVTAMELGAYGSGSRFFENNNNFAASVTMYAYTASADTTGVHLGTRDKLVRTISDNGASVAIPTDQYGTIVLKSTHTAPVMTGTPPPNGALGRIIFYHPSGGAGTAQPTTNFFGSSAATTADTSTHAWEYVCTVANSALRMLMTIDGKALGNGAP